MANNHKNFAETTLAAAVTDTTGTSITVTSSASFPSAPFIIGIDTECMLVTNVSGTTWTVTRGYESSTAATHSNGAPIYHDISAAEADSIDAKLAKAGGTMTGPINMGNHDITYVKLLQLNGEIDDGNSGASDLIDWNTGTAHKATLTGNVTLAFTGASDTVPAMTADDAPSGYTASASSVLSSGHEAWRAFSDVVGGDASIWMAGAVPSTGSPQWLQMQFAVAHTITKYSLRTRDYPAGQPTDWTLLGSNNGTDWTTLDTRTGVTWNTNERKEFTIASPASFSYYRFRCTADSNNVLAIDEMELLEGVVDPASPCYLALKVIQDATGGRKITWPATVKGSPLYDLAANAVTNLLFYWDGTYYWLLNNSGRVSVPASATAKGLTGQWAANGSYFYYCSATDTWVRTALATWT